MTKIEFETIWKTTLGMWSRSPYTREAEEMAKAWAQTLMAHDAREVSAAIAKLAKDPRRERSNGESPFPTVPEILRTIEAGRDRTTPRLLLRPPDITPETIAELERYADEATTEGRFKTAEWYANAAAAYAAELAHRRAGGRARPVPVDLAGVVAASIADNARAA